jgi:flavin-dependent thymidylate synthase
MEVRLVQYTAAARELLVLSKRTRHLVGQGAWDEVLKMSIPELEEELKYVFGTIGSSWEFVDYTFLITDVTRAFTHQLVRHRVGVAFAQQAQRVGTQEDFGYMVPQAFEDDKFLGDIYRSGMEQIDRYYRDLIANGARQQDARGVLPTNIHTNILFKVNLRALSDMLTVRLCLRAQGEFQDVAKQMKKKVVAVHPWVEQILQPNCVRYNSCKFPNYEKCPISQGFPELRKSCSAAAKDMFDGLSGTDFQPDPETDYKK